jgi:transcriptional regulator with PAS, ATPase and Fis domain
MGRDQTTASGRYHDLNQNYTAPLIWKLRPVYAADAGIVKAEPKAVRGTAPIHIGRGDSTTASGRRLFLQDARVSREHAQVYVTESGAFVEDLGSKNGTDINGRRLPIREPHALADGDVLRLGDSFVIVRQEAGTVPDARIPSLVGVSQPAAQLRCAVARCSLTGDAALILGETGTGKEVVAQAIHTMSGRPGKLVSVNCAALPATLAEAQFFGVTRGAYTGAVEQAGFFGEAHNGTLFLDEVGDLPLDLQPKLLRAIETRQVTPLGSTRPMAWDVRVVAATNRDLEAAIKTRAFRADLYARLASIVVRTPLLRERREDILPLLQHFGGADLHPSPRLVAALLAYAWPLNVREVGHVAAGLRAGSEAEEIRRLEANPKGVSLPASVGAGVLAPSRPPSPASPGWRRGDAVPGREEVVRLLEQYQGSLRRIEKEHGYARRNMRRWAERYGIDLSQYRQDPE